MRNSEKLHVVAAAFLSVGFLGGFALVASIIWAPQGGGANIGMGLLAPVCFLVGLAGMALAVAANVSARRERRRARAVPRR